MKEETQSKSKRASDSIQRIVCGRRRARADSFRRTKLFTSIDAPYLLNPAAAGRPSVRPSVCTRQPRGTPTVAARSDVESHGVRPSVRPRPSARQFAVRSLIKHGIVVVPGRNGRARAGRKEACLGPNSRATDGRRKA